MFVVGQTVYHQASRRSGVVQESDAQVTYLLQDNGAEIDFPTRELSATPPVSKAEAEVATMTRALTLRDIGPEHQKVLSVIPVRTLQAVAALWERRPAAGRFSALNTAQKLNFIAEVTEVPYRVMRLHTGEPGNLGLMMARGLADRTAATKPR
jgi:hypothetical protein